MYIQHRYRIFYLLSLLIICSLSGLNAQTNSTLETKVLDALSEMPAKNQEHLDSIMVNIMAMGTEGVQAFTERLIPSGEGNDSQARYLLHSLANFAGRPSEGFVSGSVVEEAFLTAIDQSNDKEVQTFLIRRLAFCGTDASVDQMSSYLSDPDLFKPAISTLSYIGTDKASKAILSAANSYVLEISRSAIKALGDLQYDPAAEILNDITLNRINQEIDRETARISLMALSEIANASSHKILLKAANTAGFRKDEKEAVIAYTNYGNRLLEKNDRVLAAKVGAQILKNCTAPDQLQFRSSAIHLLSAIEGTEFNKSLLKEIENQDKNYRGSVLDAASKILTVNEIESWIKAFEEASLEAKPQIIRMLGQIDNPAVFEHCLQASIGHQNEDISIAAIKMLVYQEKSASLDLLLEKLKDKSNEHEKSAIEETLLRICDKEDITTLAESLPSMQPEAQAIIVKVLGARGTSEEFSSILELAGKGNNNLDEAVYGVLGSISTTDNLPQLVELLEGVDTENAVTSVQEAIIQVLDHSNTDHANEMIRAYNSSKKRERLLPILAATGGDEALHLTAKALNSGSETERVIALQTLSNWRNNEAIPVLYKALDDSAEPSVRSDVFYAYLKQVSGSTHTNDQKLLLIKKVVWADNSHEEKQSILKACRNIQTFLSLVFVSNYLNDEELISLASGTAIAIALPTPTFKGLSGDIVRDIVSRSINNLSGPDSQYLKIDVKEFLDNMSNETGYIPIFNGKDLNGWQGLVDDPIKRAAMSEKRLADKQAAANTEMMNDWVVKDGHLTFIGEEFKNICTTNKYEDFSMLIDWKIGKGGDSGVYLRGAPQVQIWDTALVEVGAEVGSGGLYNNISHPDKPLVVADNPVNEWNTFRITIIGEKVTVYLNGQLVVDQVVFENYWNREIPIFTSEAIELQAHGENVAFRNVYVKELIKDHSSN